MEYVIGVDIGTTSTKSIAFDLNGGIIVKKEIHYPIMNPKPDRSEQDPEEIFKAVLDTIKQIVDEVEGRNPLGVSFSSAMHSLIAVDENGWNISSCIIWADSRSRDYAKKIKEGPSGHDIYMHTGTPVHPMSPLCKISWIRDNDKDLFNSAYKFISIKEYVFLKLFGEYIIDYSIASATGMFDIYEFKWFDKALDTCGIDEKKLSKPVPVDFSLRGMNEKYAEYMGIAESTPFIVGASDGCLANLGVNAINPGEGAVTIGTSGAVRVMSDKPVTDKKEMLFSYILDREHYCIGGAVNNGGIVFRWFRDNFSGSELLEAEEKGCDPYELLTEKASRVAPGSDGLIFLPYLLGERAPHWDPNARGVYFGINIKHSREHFLRALLEGIIYGLYSVGNALEETAGDIGIIYATGGFVRSKLWIKILSDVFGKKVAIAESFESSCFGAAVLCMKALGIITHIDEVKRFVPISSIFEPDMANHEVYMERFKVFERLYYKLKDEFINTI